MRITVVAIAGSVVGLASAAEVHAETSGAETEAVQLQEVIVTAQKREERLQDVPMSLTALSGEDLTNTQSFRFEDYVGKVPGLNLIDFGSWGSQLVIRGITTGTSAINSSVATYIDETPYTAVGLFGATSSRIAPNLDTFDMQRIEVLRGPQGTLYGANAMAGLLKYVTNAPDSSRFEAKAEAGASSVDSGGTGFDVHAMVNMPLASNLALRVVGYDNEYQGFIDDPSRGAKDINAARFTGGRVSLLYRPADTLSVRLSALYQDRHWDDFGNVDVNAGTLTPLYGRLTQRTLTSQPGSATNQLYNMTLNWQLGAANLMSTSSYADYRFHGLYDQSNQLGGAVSFVLGAPFGVLQDLTTNMHAFTQEVRVSSSSDGPLQWQVGGFFTDQHGLQLNAYAPIDRATRAVLYDFPVNIAGFYIPVRYREYAGFANVDYSVFPTVDVSLGGRYSRNDQTFREAGSGIFGNGISVATDSSEGVFTYSAGIRWHPTTNTMLYARVAEGFAPGGPNDAVPNAVIPSSYSSSTTRNYELGIKSELLDHRLSLTASAFDVEWHKIQVLGVINAIGIVLNGGGARSVGTEWALSYIPVRGLTLGLNGAYTHAYLTQPTPATVGGQPGDRLPAAPLLSGSASAEYARPLFGGYTGFLGLDWRYTGSRFADFVAPGPRQEMPSFSLFDLRAGAEKGNWSLALYVKNIGDKIAVSYVIPATLAGGSGPQTATVTSPRTVGLALTGRF